jgi:surface-anchored protein
MKEQNTQFIGRIRQLGLAALLTTGLASQAQTLVGTGGEHVDVGAAYDETANEWELHVHDEDNDVEYFPATDARLFIGYGANTTMPAGSQWSFIGSAGSETWILPGTPTPGLMLLGFGAEEIDLGIFVDDQFNMALKGVSGPGTFAVFDLDAFNNPLVLMNSGDGINGADAHILPAGAHQDLNWAFSAPGDYTITFVASGVSRLNGATSSGDVNYLFHVQPVPEPGVMTLAGVGALAVLLVRKMRRD